MSAIHLTSFAALGDPTSAGFEVVAQEIPVPKSGEVVVKMRLAPVNPADIFSITGVYPGFTPAALPAIPGLEGMGEIAIVGPDCTSGLQIGQRVVPFLIYGDENLKTGQGSWCSYVVVKEDRCFPVPAEVSDASAAQLVVNPMTALCMIEELNIPKGGFLLQSAAGSVLGRQVIQLCKLRGIVTINVVRRRSAVEELLAFGADHVICSADEDIIARVKEITGGNGADGALDPVGGEGSKLLSGSVKNFGTVIIYGAMEGIEFKGSIVDVLFRGVTIKGFWVTLWAQANGMAKCHALAETLFGYMANGSMVPYTGEVLLAAQVKEAVAKAIEPARGGKVLLNLI